MTEWDDLDFYRDAHGGVWADADGCVFRVLDYGALGATEWETIQSVAHSRGPLTYLGRDKLGGSMHERTGWF